MTGTTSLLVSPVSWTHHWVWILPALVGLARGGKGDRIAAACGYLLFAVSPLWWTPHSLGRPDYGFHGALTVVANAQQNADETLEQATEAAAKSQREAERYSRELLSEARETAEQVRSVYRRLLKLAGLI